MPNKTYHFRIVLLGPGSVGKSALAVRFVNNSFNPRYDPTIEQTFSKSVEVDGSIVQLEIYDTAGTVCSRRLTSRSSSVRCKTCT